MDDDTTFALNSLIAILFTSLKVNLFLNIHNSVCDRLRVRVFCNSH